VKLFLQKPETYCKWILMSYGLGKETARQMDSEWVKELAWTFAKNYSYYCRQSPSNIMSASPSPSTSSSSSLVLSCPTSRRIGNLIQLSGGRHINSAVYCIRSTKCSRMASGWCGGKWTSRESREGKWLAICLGCNFNEPTKFCFISFHFVGGVPVGRHWIINFHSPITIALHHYRCQDPHLIYKYLKLLSDFFPVLRPREIAQLASRHL